MECVLPPSNLLPFVSSPPFFFSLKRGHVKCALTLDLHIFHQKIIPKLTSRPYHFTVQHNYLQNDSKKKSKNKKRGRTTGRSRVVIRER